MKKLILVVVGALLAWNIYLTYKVNEIENSDDGGKVVIKNTVSGDINDVTTLVDSVKENVVSIETSEGTFTGIVVSKDEKNIDIMSVYDASNNPTVIFDSGARLQGSVLGKDESSNLCLIEVEADFEVEGFALSDVTSLIGENIISISGRNIHNENMMISMGFSSNESLFTMKEDSDYLSVGYTSDMNVGDDQIGAPVLDLDGNLVGIVSFQDEQHISYIISVSEIKKVYQELKDNGEVTRGILDVVVRPVEGMESYEKNENGFSLDTNEGLYVSEVESNSCAYGVLKHGDRIIQIDEKEMNSYEDLRNFQYKKKSGDEVKITFERDQSEMSATVVLK